MAYHRPTYRYHIVQLIVSSILHYLSKEYFTFKNEILYKLIHTAFIELFRVTFIVTSFIAKHVNQKQTNKPNQIKSNQNQNPNQKRNKRVKDMGNWGSYFRQGISIFNILLSLEVKFISVGWAGLMPGTLFVSMSHTATRNHAEVHGCAEARGYVDSSDMLSPDTMWKFMIYVSAYWKGHASSSGINGCRLTFEKVRQRRLLWHSLPPFPKVTSTHEAVKNS